MISFTLAREVEKKSTGIDGNIRLSSVDTCYFII